MGNGFSTGSIKNETTKYALTIGVPSGAVLDGTTNGTVTILPFQKASFYLDADGWHTYWEDRTPLVLQRNITAAVASVDGILPLGYSDFEIQVSEYSASTQGDFVARLSNDGGATFRSGSNDYSFQQMFGANSGAGETTGLAAGIALIRVADASPPAQAKGISSTLMSAASGVSVARTAEWSAGNLFTAMVLSGQSNAGGNAAIYPVSALRFVPDGGGTFTGNIAIRAIP